MYQALFKTSVVLTLKRQGGEVGSEHAGRQANPS